MSIYLIQVARPAPNPSPSPNPRRTNTRYHQIKRGKQRSCLPSVNCFGTKLMINTRTRVPKMLLGRRSPTPWRFHLTIFKLGINTCGIGMAVSRRRGNLGLHLRLLVQQRINGFSQSSSSASLKLPTRSRGGQWQFCEKTAWLRGSCNKKKKSKLPPNVLQSAHVVGLQVQLLPANSLALHSLM